MGHAQVSLGRLDDAIATFERAVRVCERVGDRASLGAQLGNLGSVYRDKGDYDGALRSYLEAFAVFEGQTHWLGVADQCSNVGYILAMRREREAALAWFTRARVLYQRQGEVRKAGLVENNIQALRENSDDGS
jgi:tetratricopeptide (TPR) repeat protein